MCEWLWVVVGEGVIVDLVAKLLLVLVLGGAGGATKPLAIVACVFCVGFVLPLLLLLFAVAAAVVDAVA